MLYGDRDFDPAKAAELLISDKQHRMRVALAEEISAEAATQFPIPARAAHGGERDADPSSHEQVLLTQGAQVNTSSRVQQVCSLLACLTS